MKQYWPFGESLAINTLCFMRDPVSFHPSLSISRLAFCLSPLLLCLTSLPAAALPDLFTRFSADREGLYAGEPFQLTLALHIAGDTLDKPVSISGLPSPDQLRLGPFQELPIETVTMEGQTYEVRRFRCRAEARIAGSIVLAPVLHGNRIQETRSYFFVQRQQIPVNIPTEPLTLIVRPLPEAGRPAKFSGAIGRFSFLATVDPQDVAVGDLITVTLRIEGDGLPDDFIPPRVSDRPGLKVYEMKPVAEESSGMLRTFRQTVVPSEATLSAIPAIAFTFFEARAGSYRTLTSGPFPLTFHAEKAPAHPIYAPPSSSAATSPVVTSAPPSARKANGGFNRLKNLLFGRQPITLSGDHEVIVRLAPSQSAQPLFTLKPGVTVFRESSTKGWTRISCRSGIGWIEDSAVSHDP
jgi:hypothetical protein